MKELVIDAGNTRIKIAIFIDSTLYTLNTFPSTDINTYIDFLKNTTYDKAILSSVLDSSTTNFIISHLQDTVVVLTKDTPIPFQIEYNSRETLGKDRLANTAALFGKTTQNALAIDFGTCIKFDFLTAEKYYLGGSISPGLQMRFRAMNEFTGKLPLLNNLTPTKLIGDSTVNSMTSGVMNGAKYEIEGMINAYQQNFKDLVIFVTGGDALVLDLNSVAPLIYDEHLTINGLYTILRYQNEQ